MDALKLMAESCMKKDLPVVNVGDTVRVIHSPAVASVEVIRSGKVRRAKLYYLRDRVGKAAKVKEVK